MDKNKGVNRTFARGGDTHMFQQQAAATRRPGKTGKDDVRGPSKKFPEGGVGTPGKRSKIGVAAPSAPGRTGNVFGSTPRDYAK
jgi:hypothetical protein